MFQPQKDIIRLMKKKVRRRSSTAFFVFLLLFHFFPENSKSAEPIEIVELPTAGILSKGTYAIQSNFFANGGMRLGFLFAPFTNFMLGISFGGTNIVGSGEATFQKLPAVHLSFRFLDEKTTFPALALGISTQGYGYYDSRLQRFQTYSPGIFFVASKGFKNFLGIVDFHLGMNYSFEPKPSERNVNIYAGVAQSVIDYIQLNLEFNSNLDEKTTEVMQSKGLLNISLVFLVNPNVKIGIILKDLLGNFRNGKPAERNISIQYYGKF